MGPTCRTSHGPRVHFTVKGQKGPLTLGPTGQEFRYLRSAWGLSTGLEAQLQVMPRFCCQTGQGPSLNATSAGPCTLQLLYVKYDYGIWTRLWLVCMDSLVRACKTCMLASIMTTHCGLGSAVASTMYAFLGLLGMMHFTSLYNARNIGMLMPVSEAGKCMQGPCASL